jgi:hypothetical protein
MNLQYLNWKIFLDNPAEAEPEEWFKVWNGWIPDSPEVFLDVADYSHVHDGPVMVLVGHFLNLSLDANNRRPGLLYDYKQPMEGGNADKLLSTLLGLLKAARRLEGETALTHKPRFAAGELQLIVNSRAVASNTPEAFQAVKGEVEALAAKVYGAGNFSLHHEANPRLRLSVSVKAKAPATVEDLLARLG